MNTRITFAATLLSTTLACQKQVDPTPGVAEVATASNTRADADWSTDSVELIDNFNRIRFPTDSAELTVVAKDRLDRAAVILNDHRTVRVAAMGHADERGAAEYNRDLALERARVVDAYLESKGVPPRQVRALSAGEAVPLVDESSRTAWSLNRRVEFLVTWDPYDQVDGSEEDSLWEASIETDTIF